MCGYTSVPKTVLCFPHFCVYICIVFIIIMCNVRLRSLHEQYCNRFKDTCKCIFFFGASACLTVFWFFQANKTMMK